MSNLSVSLEPSCRNETQSLHVCKQVWLWLPGKVSLKQPHLQLGQFVRLSARKCSPIAPLKVADITAELDDISGGFLMEKFGSGRQWPI